MASCLKILILAWLSTPALAGTITFNLDVPDGKEKEVLTYMASNNGWTPLVNGKPNPETAEQACLRFVALYVGNNMTANMVSVGVDAAKIKAEEEANKMPVTPGKG